MRARTSRRAGWLVVVAAMSASILGVTNAGADHGADAVGWISQAGDGGGTSDPVIGNFSLRTVLFDVKRFGTTDGAARPGFTKYTAWGVIQTPVSGILAGQLVTVRSENGTLWGSPIPNFIKNPENGEMVPFLLNDRFADVAFRNAPLRPASPEDVPFAIYWLAQGPSTSEIHDIHRALSEDGVVWEFETPIGQSSDFPPDDPAQPASLQFGGGGTPVLPTTYGAEDSYGPTDIIYNPSGSTAVRCGNSIANVGSVNPWQCRWVLVYDAVTSEHNIALAGSHNGLLWYGINSPILAPGAAGEWDENAAAAGHIRQVGGEFHLYYSGTNGTPSDCFAGEMGCWSIGVATSNNGLTFTKAASNPATPSSLFDTFSKPPFTPSDRSPTTLLFAQAVNDQVDNGLGHARIYFTRIDNGDGSDPLTASRDTFLAYTSPAPGQGPQIRIAQPVGPFRNKADTPVEVYLTDTLGTNIGVDMTTLSITLDTNPVLGYDVEFPHLVTALKFPAHKVTRPSGLAALGDGLHTLTVSVADLDGNVSTETVEFILDTVPPETTITADPGPGPVLGFPLASIGVFKGTTVEAPTGTAIERIDVTVTNPLGIRRIYQIADRPNGPIIKHSDKIWDWTWVGPTPDPQFLVPGFYTISFLAQDVAQNREQPDAQNTRTILVL